MPRPRLVIDLQGPDGNVYVVIAKARQIVPVDQLDGFINAILDAQRLGANKTYEDMLAIINSYVELVDSSGVYPAYGPQRVDLPPLLVNLSGSFSDIYIVIDLAGGLLSPAQRLQLERELEPLIRHFAWKKHKEILAVIAKYVHLHDVSGTHPDYPVAKERDRVNEAAIIAAVDRLQEQLRTLPDWIGCALEDLYPDFAVPECGPEIYLALVEDEVGTVKARIDQADEGQCEPLQRLLTMLVECSINVQLAGVTLEGDGETGAG